MPKTKDEVLALIDENKVKYIRLWFTDIYVLFRSPDLTSGREVQKLKTQQHLFR